MIAALCAAAVIVAGLVLYFRVHVIVVVDRRARGPFRPAASKTTAAPRAIGAGPEMEASPGGPDIAGTGRTAHHSVARKCPCGCPYPDHWKEHRELVAALVGLGCKPKAARAAASAAVAAGPAAFDTLLRRAIQHAA